MSIKWISNSLLTAIHAAIPIRTDWPLTRQFSFISSAAESLAESLNSIQQPDLEQLIQIGLDTPTAQLKGKLRASNETSLDDTSTDELILRLRRLEELLAEHQQKMLLRSRPLVEHWDARGPGLLGWLRRWKPETSIPDTTVALVLPTRVISAPYAFPRLGLIQFECHLTHVSSRLPEPLRLARHLLELIVEPPPNSRLVNIDEQAITAQLRRAKEAALTRLTLAAGEYVEWIAECDSDLYTEARNLWTGEVVSDHEFEIVERWWQDTAQADANLAEIITKLAERLA